VPGNEPPCPEGVSRCLHLNKLPGPATFHSKKEKSGASDYLCSSPPPLTLLSSKDVPDTQTKRTTLFAIDTHAVFLLTCRFIFHIIPLLRGSEKDFLVAAKPFFNSIGAFAGLPRDRYRKEMPMLPRAFVFFSKILVLIILTASTAGISGCTPPVWYHPDQKDPLNFQQDLSQCHEETAKFTPEMHGDVKKTAVKERLKACMKTKGYSWGKVNDVPNDYFVYEDKE